jgi:hypothetical protein
MGLTRVRGLLNQVELANPKADTHAPRSARLMEGLDNCISEVEAGPVEAMGDEVGRSPRVAKEPMADAPRERATSRAAAPPLRPYSGTDPVRGPPVFEGWRKQAERKLTKRDDEAERDLPPRPRPRSPYRGGERAVDRAGSPPPFRGPRPDWGPPGEPRGPPPREPRGGPWGSAWPRDSSHDVPPEARRSPPEARRSPPPYGRDARVGGRDGGRDSGRDGMDGWDAGNFSRTTRSAPRRSLPPAGRAWRRGRAAAR